ncbi:MAG: transporter [Hyphomicrobiales bacterium]|nr:transporter [Hyphomicrobiales bacterium]
MRLRLFWIALALAALGGALYVWREGVFAPPVTLVEATRGSAVEVVYATGIVEPVRWAKVISLARKRIVELCDCEGKPVKTGDVLARLDDYEERASLAELEARRERISGDVERIRGLVTRNAAPQTQLDQNVTLLREFDARISAQKDRINDLILRAPMDGVVLRRDGEVGEIAGTGGGDVLFWVGQPSPLRIVADVNEEDVPRVKRGQKALLRSEGFRNRTLEASVSEITPKGDPATKTFRVYLGLPADTPLLIGMSVEANIVTQERPNVVLLPSEAIQDGAVFRVEDGRLRRRRIDAGLRGTRMVEIVAGVQEGEEIASPALSTWREGMRVRVEGAVAREAP